MTPAIRKRNVVLVIAGIIILAAIAGFFVLKGDNALAKVHAGIESQFPEVSHVTVSELESMPSDQIILFDTREPSEFEVSHLSGAIQVDPNIDTVAFMERYGRLLAGKTAVFYCSVGARSTAIADAVQTSALIEGATQVVNLERGIFGWHNEGLSLVDGDGNATEKIHPFNAFWGRLVDRKELIHAP